MMTTGCVSKFIKPKPEPVVDEAVVINAAGATVQMSEFKGFGEITMSKAGQKMTGKFDALRKNSGSFSAQVYSPFGSAVASISASDFAGRVNIDREQIDFTYDETMEKVPFPCAKYFTYGNFVRVLTASMPDEFWALAPVPDTLIQSKKKKKGKKTVGAAWISDSLTVRAEIIPKNGQLESVSFNYVIDGKKLTMQFSRFKKGVPYEILIRESAKNYISVSYETITWK